MPSTGWNVFVASLVALVVYIAVQAEVVLLGIGAGTLTFVTGWLLGYAINQDLLDSMELSRLFVAGGVTAFAAVYTLLYSQQQYILGLVVVCLVWFAAWFTSSMGPIKGNTGAMETIDEPRPPAGTEPGEPLHLGGPESKYNDDDGFLGGLLSFDGDSSAEYATTPNRSSDTAPRRATAQSTGTEAAEAHSRTTSSEESIFGLGIFYEEAPASEAGADEQAPARTNSHSSPDPAQQSPQSPQSLLSPQSPQSLLSPPSPQSDDGAVDSAGRDAEHPPAGSAPAAAHSSHDATPTTGDADEAEEPPEEHRVEVADDDGGFVFG